MRIRKSTNWLPLLLPVCMFFWDFAALEWVFAHEPGITARVVFYFDLALLPGTLLFSPMPAILLNGFLAFSVGLALIIVPREHKPQSTN